MRDEQWAAIEDAAWRLVDARVRGDRRLAIGSAKELVESVAKCVLISRGDEVRSTKFGNLITDAHKSLDAQPGEGTAAAEPLRSMADSAKKLAMSVNALRSTHGTGHGTGALTPVDEDQVDLAADAGVMWCRWALRRLAMAQTNPAETLITDLLGGATFHKGTLKARLAEIGLDTLPPQEARRLGRAAAHRGVHGETFVVFDDGVRPAVEHPASFPTSYVMGVVEGSLFDTNGYLRPTRASVRCCAALLVAIGDTEFINEVIARIRVTDLSYATKVGELPDVAQEFRNTSAVFGDPGTRADWSSLADRFLPPSTTDES